MTAIERIESLLDRSNAMLPHEKASVDINARQGDETSQSTSLDIARACTVFAKATVSLEQITSSKDGRFKYISTNV